jgi:hypothetical protein
MGLVTAFSRRNMQPILHCVVSFVWLTYLLPHSLTQSLTHSLTTRNRVLV